MSRETTMMSRPMPCTVRAAPQAATRGPGVRCTLAAQRTPAAARGFTLVELMVGIAIGLMLISGLAIVFASSSQSYGELHKQSQQIENGRYAIDVIRDDLQHAGYVGTRTHLPAVPASVPNPCDVSIGALSTALALPVQGYDAPASSPISSCLSSANHVNGTDILVVRRAHPEPITAPPELNRPYIQASASGLEVQAGDPTGFAFPALNGDNTVSAVGTKASGSATATVLKMMNKAGAVPVVTAARVAADIRPVRVHVYFVAPCSRPASGQTGCTSGADGGKPIPTLKRLELDMDGGVAQMVTRVIAEGIENLQVDYGFDTTPTAVNLATGFRGDGVVDIYAKSLTGVGTGTFVEWANVMSARVYVLARNPTATAGFSDTKTYAMGLAGIYTPADKTFRRHLFTAEVRLVNMSSRREEPK